MKCRSYTRYLLACCAVSVVPLSAGADELKKLHKAIADGNAYIDARYRYETVDQSNLSDDAKASTLRTRAGYKTGKYRGVSGVLEFENVSAVGSDDYNDGGATRSKSNTNIPTVADPEGTELNQAYLQFDGVKGVSLKGGRHTLNRGNMRFIGSVGWRQNNQNHDGATITLDLIPDTTLFYGYSYNINRIFGDDDLAGDFSGDIHMVDAVYKGIPYANISAFGYFIDIDVPSGQWNNSSDTYGARIWGAPEVYKGVKLLFDGSWATQSEGDNNTISYDADYWNAELGVSFAGLTIKAGYEELGSDNDNFAFRTPLATLHKFNGWADQFLSTPNNGLEDTYVKASYKVNGIHDLIDGTKLMVAYHDFSPEGTGGDYGSEFDFDIKKTFAKHYTLGFRYADFDTDNNGIGAINDVEKLIFTVGVKFNNLGKFVPGSKKSKKGY